jgi:UDP-N-acetylmuramate dehydrogenase
VGAAPVQNIGAYGQEVADTILSVDVFDTQTNQFAQLQNSDCNFGYRDSIFRNEEIGRYGITGVTFRLFKTMPQPPFYKALEDYFAAHNITVFTPQIVREAVIAIRMEKLPDPKERPNSGSFFKNAVVEDWQFNMLIEQYPDMPNFEMAGGKRKIPTGWLIDKTGLKGTLLHGMRVHDKNALVLINESATGYADLAAAREEIQKAVRTLFQVEIIQEPLEI